MVYTRVPTSTPPTDFPPSSRSSSPPLSLQSPSFIQRHRQFVYAALLLLIVGAPVTLISHSVTGSAFFSSSEELAVENYVGVEQLKPVVLPAEEELRRFTWKAKPHSSLDAQLKKLTSSERRVRDWLYTTRKRSSLGTGIGIGASSPPQPLRPGKPFPAHRGAPGRTEGPGWYEGGSQEKYAELEREWRNGYQVYPIEGEKWMARYTKLHAEILRGEREPRLIEYTCPAERACGGLADRMLGMITTFLYAVVSDRAISLTWEQPLPLDMIFDSPFVDWSNRFLPAPSPARHSIYDNQTTIDTSIRVDGHLLPSDNMKGVMTNLLEDDKTKSTPLVVMDAFNAGRVIGMFPHPPVVEKLASLGLTVHSAWAQLMRYLLRPKPSTLEFIHQYSSLFALPSIYSVGIHVRTGDQSMESPEGDAENTVERYRFYFDCAAAAAETYSKPGQRVVYYLITDSVNLRNEAIATFGDKMVISGLHQQHGENFLPDEDVPAGQLPLKKIKYAYTGDVDAVAETWTFAETDFSILTADSGYAKFPSFMRGKPNAQIALSRWGDDRDCRLETSLSRFSELAETWSLG